MDISQLPVSYLITLLATNPDDQNFYVGPGLVNRSVLQALINNHTEMSSVDFYAGVPVGTAPLTKSRPKKSVFF